MKLITVLRQKNSIQFKLDHKNSQGIALPEVHGVKKMLDTSVLPEKQKPQLQDKQVVENRPRLGQGKAGIRCRKPLPVDG